MLNHSSPCLAPARESSGLETAGYFLSKQPPVPFQPQPACPSCCSGGWRWPLGLGKHSHYLPQGAGLSPSDTAAPCPLFLRQQQRWPTETGCEQVWEEAFRQLKQLLSASSQKKKQQTGEQSNMPMWQWQLLPCQPAVTATSTCWPVKIGPAIQHVLDCPGQGFSAHLTVFCRHRESTALSIFTSKLNENWETAKHQEGDRVTNVTLGTWDLSFEVYIRFVTCNDVCTLIPFYKAHNPKFHFHYQCSNTAMLVYRENNKAHLKKRKKVNLERYI